MMWTKDDEVTEEWLQKELSETENALASVERQRSGKPSNTKHNNKNTKQLLLLPQSPVQRLVHLQDTVEYLQLSNAIIQCQKEYQAIDRLNSSLEQQVKQCETIGQLLCRRPRPNNPNSHYGKLFGLLWEQEYQPLYNHVKWTMIASLRQLLQRTGYPSVEACSMMLQQDTNVATTASPAEAAQPRANQSSLAFYCQLLTRLQLNHHQVFHHVVVAATAADDVATLPASRGVGVDKSSDIVVVELLRPIVERVQYHFVEKRVEQQKQKSSSKKSPAATATATVSSLTISRLDHLPEWIITYLRDHVLPEGGPWDLVRLVVAPFCVTSNSHTGDKDNCHDNDDDANYVLVHFLNEVIRLIQWVLVERNFFRHAQITGPRSNPILLCRAIEQLMTLDVEFKEMLPAVGNSQRSYQQQQQQLHQQHPVVLLRLTDIMLAQDDDLFHWWLEREREFALSTLFEDEPNTSSLSVSSTSTQQPLWQLRVAPRAELFCVLIRSIQAKAANFTRPGPYLAHVAVPLCMQFLDAIHESSQDLRNFLSKRTLPNEADLRANVLEWMDLINGTHLSASVLIKGDHYHHRANNDSTLTSDREVGVDHDLVRLGTSLQRLQDVLVDEFGSAFVETLLMERARLASYLMQAPHQLSDVGDNDDDMDAPTAIPTISDATLEVPVELEAAKSMLDQLVHVCDAVAAQVSLAAGDGGNETSLEASLAATWEVAKFAAQAMRRNVMNRLAEKFLEIVLDFVMVPEIVEQGARKFAWNVRTIFGQDDPPSGALTGRLMDVVNLMTLDSKQLLGLKSALSELAMASSAKQPIDLRAFEADGTIYDEAVSMIRTKSFALLELEDAISILNRRRLLVIP